MFSTLQILILLGWLLTAITVSIFGLNSYILLWLSRRKSNNQTTKRIGEPVEWPLVTIQIPTYNEGTVIERTLKDCLSMNYPKDKLEIIVVDDSTDETTQLLREFERRHRQSVRVIHRLSREGYKAGALNEAMKHSKGEFFLILDADTSPSRSFLKEVIPYLLADEKLGFIQGKVEYINTEKSWLAGSIALANDWYRVFTQSALSKGGMLLSFLGHAGIFRRSAIEDAGGWESDTLTEDMDLSYRAQMKGWRGLFLEEARCVEEVPPSYLAAVIQYDRHLRGPIQNLRKHGLPLLRSKHLSPIQKFEGLLQMAYPLCYPLTFLCLTLGVLAHLLLPVEFLKSFWLTPAGLTILAFTFTSFPYISFMLSFYIPALLLLVLFPVLYMLTRTGGRGRRLKDVLGAIFIWNDNIITGTKVLFSLLMGRKGTWIRTLRVRQTLRSEALTLKRRRMEEAALRIIPSALILSLFTVIMSRGLTLQALGLAVPAVQWIVSAYLLLKPESKNVRIRLIEPSYLNPKTGTRSSRFNYAALSFRCLESPLIFMDHHVGEYPLRFL